MLVRMTEEPEDYEGPWPEGDAMTEWVMVPREPTEQMLVALANTPCRVGWPAKAYRAMLDAAPAAPVQPVQAQGEPVEIVPRVWREALRKLTFMARTSGGSAVPDKELQAACAQAEALLSKPYNYPPAAPQQADPVAQIGWADEFGNLFPMGAWKPTQRTHHDSHKTAWRPVFLHPPAAEAQRLREAAMAVVDAYRNIGPVTVAIEDLSRAL